MKKILVVILCCVAAQCLLSQSTAYGSFRDRWLINSPSVETLPARKLDARIAHRFGDIAGSGGGWATFFGLENAADIAIGAEYGFTDNMTFGFARSKGAGSLKQLLNAHLKYRMYEQKDSGAPFSLAAFALASLSTSEKSDDPSSVNYFEKFPHRFVYHFALLASRKFSNKFSIQISSGITHRNAAPFGEENNLLHTGLAFKFQLSKTLGLIGDFTVPLNGTQSPFNTDTPLSAYYVPIGIGLEFDTGGHIFQINLTNASGLMPTDYVPYNRNNWLDGQYRLSFTISRMFNL